MRKQIRGRTALILGLAVLVMASCGASGQREDESKPEEGKTSAAEAAERPAGEGETYAAEQMAGKGETFTAEDDADAAIQEETGTAEAAVQETGTVEPGMKLSILGDSISTFEGWIPEGNSVFYPENGAVKDVSQTWWKIVLDELDLTLCTNGSSSGSASFGYSQEADPMFGCSDYRISQLAGADGEAPDIIIVYMGTNDVLMSASVGENDGLRAVEEGLVGSLSDGYTMILDKIGKQYPAARVYCCTLLPVGDWGTTESQPFVPLINGQKVTSEAYSERIRLIAKNRGLPVIDLEKCGITLENMAQMTADGVHPTPEGMRLIADTVKKSLTGRE